MKLLLVTAALAGQLPDGPSVTRLNVEALEANPRIPLSTHWKYSVDDDPRFADPNFDDRDWDTFDAFCPGQRMPPGWTGKGWFRFHLEVEPELLKRRLAVFAYHVGAYELYVDGELVASEGDFGAQSLFQTPTSNRQLVGFTEFLRPRSVLAVRFGQPALGALDGGFFGSGFWLEVGEPIVSVQNLQTEHMQHLARYGLFIGMAVALGMLHLFLFWFVDEQRTHGDYAVFTLSIATLTTMVLLRSFDMSMALAVGTSIGFRASLIFLSAFGVRFFRTLHTSKSDRLSRGFFWVSAAMLLVVPWISIGTVYVFASASLFLMIYYLMSAASAGRPGLGVVVVGGIAMAVASILQMTPDIFGFDMLIHDVYLYGFTTFLICMSLFLARDVGQTHKALAGRVYEVEQLSEAHLAEQRRAQGAEMKRMRLQVENERQAELLTEAAKRDALLKEVKRVNRELHETQAQLVHSKKMASLGELVAGIAHEINTPVGAINSVHDSLERASKKLTERIITLAPEHLEDKGVQTALRVLEDSTEVVKSGSARVAKLVQRLRTFARLDEAELMRADIHEGLNDTLLLLRHKLKPAVTVRKDFGDVPPLACYPGQLNQVFMNLLVNARQAIPDDGTITIRTRSEAGWVRIEIEDSGRGIDPAHVERIFDPGFTTKGVRVGTGLGLAICYQIVQAHYGSIEVTSEPGRGAKFTVRIPTDLEERLRASARSRAANGSL